jgi:hypothetical protein
MAQPWADPTRARRPPRGNKPAHGNDPAGFPDLQGEGGLEADQAGHERALLQVFL